MNYIVNQITLFAFFQSLFLIAIFMFSIKKRKLINVYLLILILILMIGLVGRIGQFSLNWQRQIKGLSEFSILFFGPTVFLFIQSTLSKKYFSRSDLFHYIPGFIYSLIILFYYIVPSHEIILERKESGELFRVVRMLVGIGLAVNITYFILSVLKFIELKNSLEDEVSYVVNINFVRNFLIAIGCCLLTWVVVYLLSFGSYDQVEIISREFIWLAVVLIVLFITFYQMVSPTVFHFKNISKEIKYAQSKFSKEDLDSLKYKLERIMESKKPYLNSKLLKSELAQMMEINAPDLSRLLNERIGMSFFEYVNYHRIHEFIRFAKSPILKQKTLFGLAQEAGF